MYSTYLCPTEESVSTLAIKRALLTFDRVLIADPADRDFFPPQAFLSAMGSPGFLAMNMGPVRPLGKVFGYDNQLDRVMEEVGYARRAGLIDVISTYDLSTDRGMTIGMVPMGDYPLNPQFMLWAYRNIARDNSALMAAISSDQILTSHSKEQLLALGARTGLADGGINDDPELPLIQRAFASEELRPASSSIARARLASVMKSVGYCTAKQLVPSFDNPAYSQVAHHMVGRATKVVDRMSEFDRHWTMRSQVLKIAHDEYIDDSVLQNLSIDDVVALRTRAWGRQAEHRDAMLQSISSLAKEAEAVGDFEREVRDSIMAYRATFDDIARERSALKFQVSCELLQAGGAGMTAALAGSIPGALTQMQTAIGAASVLVAGCLYTIEKIKDYKPISDQLVSAEAEFRDSSRFGMHNFYRGFKSSHRP
ncbi:hypothetical protein [Rhizobium laguerreae]|uniref:hypothetical protein n=1 Tax=Rhizobium laguerreae TaxID=1076926 RepID=UPI001C90C296|nr:hypothetical protein [Rhizobium laguerreae]MBY3224715.1 hypothetical protein [Rhizobium laguerreae]